MRLPATPSPLKAALWDMDGTIVDTEPYWMAAEHALVEAHGGSWSHEQAMQLVGQSLTFSAGLLQQAGVDLGIRQIIDTLTAEVVAGVRQQVPWRPGARELLEDLHQAGVRCALVTMSEGPLAREVVASLPRPYFEVVVTGDTVAQGKPHPEAYLKAVELLRETDPELSLEHCVALEDSTPGVAAAVASGVATVAIPHIVPLPEDERYVLWDSLAGRSLADLEDLLRRARTLQNGTAGYEHNPHEAAALEGAGAPGTAHD